MAQPQESDMVPFPREKKCREKKRCFQHLVQVLFVPDPEQNTLNSSDPLLFIAQHVIPKFHCVKKKYPMNIFGYLIPSQTYCKMLKDNSWSPS